MSEISDEILKRGAADSDITAFRDECFSAWTTYRDAMETEGECADITDYRTGFFVGVCAALNARATLTEQLAEAKAKVERFEAMLGAAEEGSELTFGGRGVERCFDSKWRTQFGYSTDPDGNKAYWQSGYETLLQAFEAIQEGRDG